MDQIAEDYPRSAKNFSCLGPCYRPGIFIVHPVTLKHITNNDHPFCPVNEFEHIDEQTGKKEIRSTDKCFEPVRSGSINTHDISMNIILPRIDFTYDSFLKIYYNIYSMEDTLEWLGENSETNYFTKKRVIDCAWNAYGFNNYILDDRLIFFYLDLFKKKKSKNVYAKFYRYITVTEDGLIFKKNIDDIEYNKSKKIDFIDSKLINYINFNKFLNKYIENFSSKKEKVESHTENILYLFEDYLEKKIQLSLH